MVLDWVNGTLSSPINVRRLGETVLNDFLLSWGSLESESSVLGEELFLGEVRELVKSHSVSLGNKVGGGDGQIVLVEDSKSEVLLGWGSVVLSMLVLPSGEGSVNVWWNEASVVGVGLVETGSDQQSGGNNCESDFVHFYFY